MSSSLRKYFFVIIVLQLQYFSPLNAYRFTSRQPTRDFVKGLAIGMVHGRINKIINNTDGEYIFYGITFIAANEIGKMNTTQSSKAMEWGRGIGQCLTESIAFDTSGVTIRPSLNLTLLWAAFTQMISEKN